MAWSLGKPHGDEAAGSKREWHNHDVGIGYQAAHVIRQREPSKDHQELIIDMRGPPSRTTTGTGGSFMESSSSGNLAQGVGKEQMKERAVKKDRDRDRDGNAEKKAKKKGKEHDKDKKADKKVKREREKEKEKRRDRKAKKKEKKLKKRRRHEQADVHASGSDSSSNSNSDDNDHEDHSDNHNDDGSDTNTNRCDELGCFNPILQLLATRISNKTRAFEVRNGY